MHLDLELAFCRRQDDIPHQRSNQVGRGHPLFLRILLKRRIQFVHLNVVVMRHIRMQEGRRFLGVLQERFQLLLASLKLLYLLHHPGGSVVAIRRKDELHQLAQFLVDPFDLGLGRING
ncbi:hypothetical protein V5G24_19650 [Xanthobacter sp. VTT E-85241]|uniref:hypothetical protein n=1 Tax=Roseixanthobacter finlandensis TaxID=3119922 RepID=UPI00372C7092